MLHEQQAIRDVVDNAHRLWENIDFLLDDGTHLLRERNHTPLHTGYALEQAKQRAALLMPRYATVFYADAEDAPWTVGLGVIVADPQGMRLTHESWAPCSSVRSSP